MNMVDGNIETRSVQNDGALTNNLQIDVLDTMNTCTPIHSIQMSIEKGSKTSGENHVPSGVRYYILE